MAASTLQTSHPLASPPTISDLRFVQEICKIISHRAAAYLATAIHAMWKMRTTAEGLKPSQAGFVTIGCNGSVIEHYPNFRQVAQIFLDELVESSGGMPHSVVLVEAHESSILGAAIAACVVDCSLHKG
jgi:hexokinase